MLVYLQGSPTSQSQVLQKGPAGLAAIIGGQAARGRGRGAAGRGRGQYIFLFVLFLLFSIYLYIYLSRWTGGCICWRNKTKSCKFGQSKKIIFYCKFFCKVFLKAKLFYNQGRSVRPSVRPRRISFFVNLGMLELSYRFKLAL